MTSRIRLLVLLLCSLGIHSVTQCQDLKNRLASSKTLTDTLNAVYQSLEYKTPAHKDTKNSWLVTDRAMVYTVFEQFGHCGLVTKNGQRLEGEDSSSVVDDVSHGRVKLLVTRRTFDDQLESIAFQGSKVLLDTVYDWVRISRALGSVGNTYSQLKRQSSAIVDGTTEQFNSEQRYAYDIYLHALNPELLLWHTISGVASDRSKISVFAQLGNDHLNLPFWFKGTLVYGLHYGFVDDVVSNDRTYEKYSVYAGIETPINFSVQQSDGVSNASVFKRRKLEASGTGVFLKGSLNPWRDEFISGEMKGLVQFGVEVSLALSDKLDYAVDIPDTFYSVRNHLVMFARLRHLGIFDFGAGFAWHDVGYYTRKPPPPQRLGLIEPSNRVFLPFLEAGVSEDGSFLQYSVVTSFDYDFARGYGFLGTKVSFVFGNNFGVELRYFKAIRSSHLPVWQFDNYIVLSPVIRINY